MARDGCCGWFGRRRTIYGASRLPDDARTSLFEVDKSFLINARRTRWWRLLCQYLNGSTINRGKNGSNERIWFSRWCWLFTDSHGSSLSSYFSPTDGLPTICRPKMFSKRLPKPHSLPKTAPRQFLRANLRIQSAASFEFSRIPGPVWGPAYNWNRVQLSVLFSFKIIPRQNYSQTEREIKGESNYLVNSIRRFDYGLKTVRIWNRSEITGFLDTRITPSRI